MTRGLGGHSPANVASYLKGIDFPAETRNLAEHAKKNGAESAVMEVINSMPQHTFHNMADVMKAYKEAEHA